MYNTRNPHPLPFWHTDFIVGFDMSKFASYSVSPVAFYRDVCRYCKRLIRKSLRTSNQLFELDPEELVPPITMSLLGVNIEFFAVTRHPVPLKGSGFGNITEVLDEYMRYWYLIIIVTYYLVFYICKGQQLIITNITKKWVGKNLLIGICSTAIGSNFFFVSNDIRDGLVKPPLEKQTNKLKDIDFGYGKIFISYIYMNVVNEEIAASFRYLQKKPEHGLQDFKYSIGQYYCTMQ